MSDKHIAPSAKPRTPATRSEKKREANSPLYQPEDQQKKIRHTSGDSNVGDFFTTQTDDVEIEETSQVHVLSYPMNPSDITLIARELRGLMSADIRSEIKAAVQEAVLEVTSVFKEEIKELRAENVRIQKAYDDLLIRIDQTESDNDALEQYSRRNSLRISGIPEEETEVTDEIVIGLASSLNVEINSFDIDRSHRVGKPVGKGQADRRPGSKRHRDIIVKFARYNVRDKLFKVRKDLRNTSHYKSVYINEDLTSRRSKLLFDARSLVRNKLIKAAYSSDGKILIRDKCDVRHIIRSDLDLNRFGDVDAAKPYLLRSRAI